MKLHSRSGRHRRCPVRRIVAILLSATVVGSAGGCADPRYHAKRAERDARIEHYVSWYAEHDAAGPQRVQKTMDLDRRMAAHRARHLEQTCALVRSLHERDVRRWSDEAPLRQARAQTMFRGKPEQINDTFGRMVY